MYDGFQIRNDLGGGLAERGDAIFQRRFNTSARTRARRSLGLHGLDLLEQQFQSIELTANLRLPTRHAGRDGAEAPMHPLPDRLERLEAIG